ncbi:CusA/CzcA family heavy metal efflux RND transporter [bacterium]|nr:CusA/CzcA family heavy metal efflux RND transporter [bacterium]
MLERILQFSIQQRILVIVLVLGAAAYGVFAFQRLPIDAVPDITNNQIQINVEVPGLSLNEVEKQVTFPIETALAGVPGLKYTRSLSRNAFAQVTAVFEDKVSIYFARQQVSERLSEARESLPEGAEPLMGPIATGLGEVYMWTVEYEHPHGEGAEVRDGEPGWQPDGSYLTPEGERLQSDVELAAYLRTLQDWVISPQLKSLIPNLAGVDSIGGYVKQYHVEPDPMKLVSYGFSFGDLLEALESNNLSTGAGYIERAGESYLVRAEGRIASIPEIEQIVIGSHDGTPVHIHDVATVRIGKELRTGSASENGEEVVVGTAVMLLGANSRTVAKDVDAAMPAVRATMPPDIAIKTVLNRTKLVDATIDTVKRNLIEGAILVIVVLFLLLGNFRAALICAMAIPLAMLMTVSGMVHSKISGNLMSLGAIDFGLIVDGAVIIVENCLRLLAEKQHELGRTLTLQERLKVVLRASTQVRSATAFGEAIIITVYFPLLALTGIEGKMFQPMAYTVIFALIAAFILSLTFVPAMVAIFVSGRVVEKENFAVAALKRVYEPTLRWALRWRYAVLGIGVASFLGALWMFQGLGQEFIPTLDEKDLAVHAMRIPSTSVTQSTTMQFEVEKTISAFPEVAFVYSKTGTAEMAFDPMPPSVSDTFVIFRPVEEWPNPDEPKAELVERIEDALVQLPGNNYEFTQPIQMRFNELIAGVRSDVAVKVYGEDMDQMLKSANQIARILREVPGAADVKVEQVTGLPVMTVRPDRQALARYGLSVQDVQDVLAIAVGGREAGQVFEGDRRFELIVRMPEALRENQAVLEALPVPLPAAQGSGGLTPAGYTEISGRPGYLALGQLADIEISEGPNQISRENGKRRIVVQSNVRGRDIGSFVADAQAAIDKDLELPSGYWLDWGGQFENLVEARKRLSIVVPVCFLLILMLLYTAFGTLRHALMVFSAIPLALSGGILALWLRLMPFSITAAVGFIALSGVAVLNGLVMVSYINQLRREGMPLDEAIIQGALTRLRPVMITALVASLGFVPMALAHGTGAEVQKPLATVVIGGLISSTLLTLIVLPALYRIVERSNRPLEPQAEGSD